MGYTEGGALIVNYNGKTFHFMENGILHWQDNTIANYKYYMANKSKFVDSKGNLAKFSDVFKSLSAPRLAKRNEGFVGNSICNAGL